MSMMHFMRLALATAIICAANSIKVGDKVSAEPAERAASGVVRCLAMQCASQCVALPVAVD